MIVADRKPLDEILESVKDYKKIMVVACRGCVTVCNVGGTKEVEILSSAIKIARKKEENPIEIDERIRRNDDFTEAQIIDRFPFLSKTAGKM